MLHCYNCVSNFVIGQIKQHLHLHLHLHLFRNLSVNKLAAFLLFCVDKRLRLIIVF